MEKSLQEYNYGRVFGVLNDHFDSVAAMQLRNNTEDDYQAFHCAVGFILRENDPAKLAVLDHFCRDSEIDPESLEVASLIQIVKKRNSAKKDLKPYLEAKDRFNEDLGRRGIHDVVELDNHTIDGNPREKKFQTILSYQNRCYEGLGSNFKESELKAAKKLCEHEVALAQYLDRTQ